ncbi:hypothetical protein ACN469_11680 [Corallococcus terminator]
MNCVDCKCPLVGGGLKKYCPKCSRVYRKIGPAYHKSDTIYRPDFQLQPDVPTRNPGFKTSIKEVFLNPPAPLKPFPFQDQGHYGGFGLTHRPLLHFIWLGTPPSSLKLRAALDWAHYLKDTWGGVCLWIEPDCFKLFQGMTDGGEVEALETPGGNVIKPIDKLTRHGSAPVYFAFFDKHIKVLAKSLGQDHQARLHILKAAIDFERQNRAPFSLVQVASDILRIILLRYYGGAYFDFDVSPSSYCRSAKLPDPQRIPLGKNGFVCHRKGPLNENDIIFSDPSVSPLVLEGLLEDMCKFYGVAPSARADMLTRLMESELQERTQSVLDKYEASRNPSGELLNQLAVLVQDDTHRGVKATYPKAVDDEVLEFVKLLNDSIESATFSGFQFHPSSENEPKWERMKAHFSHETLTKPFYSWKDPGASAALQRIDAVTTIQAAIRGFLVRKQRPEQPAPQLLHQDSGEGEPMHEEPDLDERLYRLRQPTKAYSGSTSFNILEGTFQMTLERDNERYSGILLRDARVLEFRAGKTSRMRDVHALRVFVHTDVLHFPFIELA